MKSITMTVAAMVALWVSRDAAPCVQDSKPVAPRAAAPADVGSVDAIVKTLYDVISGPAGQARDWDRLRSLFIPKARLIIAAPRPNGHAQAVVLSVDEYIAKADAPMREGGFFESEIARRTETYSDIAHVFSTYESRHAASDLKPFARGINSIQLMKDKDRWWIVTIFWCQETMGTPIPATYLPGAESRR
jgi:hypothetical protein